MPRQIQSPSPFLDDCTALSPKAQADLVAVGASTGAASNLPRPTHCIGALSACLVAFRARGAVSLKALDDEQAKLGRLVEVMPPDPMALDAPRDRKVAPALWDVLVELDLSKAQRRLWEFIGAAYFLGRTTQTKIDGQILNLMASVAEAQPGEETDLRMAALEMRGAPLWQKAISALARRPRSRKSAASDLIEHRIEQRWLSERNFESLPKLTRNLGSRSLTSTELRDCAADVKRAALDGDALALVVAIGHWIGVGLWYLVQLAILAPPGTGLIRLSADSSHVRIDLSGLLDDLAKAPCDAVKATDDVLSILLPRWIADLLRILRSADPNAVTLRALLRINPARVESRLCSSGGGRDRVTASRFIDSRSQALLDPDLNPRAELDQHVIAYDCLDFRRATKSSYPYQCISLSELVQVQRVRADLILWAPLAEMGELPAAGIGSRSTPLRESVQALVQARANALEASPIGPNSGWDALVTFHNNFVLYVLLLLSLAWLLRGRKSYDVYASTLIHFSVWGFNDKGNVNPAASPTPLVCGQIVKRELQYLKAHYSAMAQRAERIVRNGRSDLAGILAILTRVSNGDEELHLLQIIDRGRIRTAGATDLAMGLAINWNFKRDGLRHLAADEQRLVGSSAEFIEELLRHVGHAFELFSAGSGISMHQWEVHAGDAQDRLLNVLGVPARPGIVTVTK